MVPRKQLKITKMFKRGAIKVTDDCDELEEEVQELKKKLEEKHTELFQRQRNRYRWKHSSVKKLQDPEFVPPQKIYLKNSTEHLKRKAELISMLTGIEVQAYVPKKYCCVVFHMPHFSDHVMSHGLRIDMESGKNEITAKSLPLGFNLDDVLDEFDDPMSQICLVSIRRALLAYYDRLEQYSKLKKIVNMDAQLFKTLDGSHIEVSLSVAEDETEEKIPITLMLDYRAYDIRPKAYAVMGDLDEDSEEVLTEQCAVFKKKPLAKAFRRAFQSDIRQFKLVGQCARRRYPAPRPHRKRPRPANPHWDDTFHPEDCSDQGEDDEMDYDSQ